MTLKKLLTSVGKSFVQAYACRFETLGYKITAFKILLRLYLKCDTEKTDRSKNEEITDNIFGYRISAFSYKDLLLMFGEIALRSQYHFETKKTSLKVIDCGANIGLTILLYKLLYPRCFVMAFEPDPENYRLLVKNMKLNKIRNVKSFNACASSKNETLDFYPNTLNRLHSSLDPQPGVENELPLKIQSIPLSSVLSGDYYDLVKIDSEGMELDIVQDLVRTNTIQNAEHYLVACHKKKNTAEQIIALFTAAGFSHKVRLPHYEKEVPSTGDTLHSFEKTPTSLK